MDEIAQDQEFSEAADSLMHDAVMHALFDLIALRNPKYCRKHLLAWIRLELRPVDFNKFCSDDKYMRRFITGEKKIIHQWFDGIGKQWAINVDLDSYVDRVIGADRKRSAEFAKTLMHPPKNKSTSRNRRGQGQPIWAW